MKDTKKMVLLTAPSGAGKTTIALRLLDLFPFLTFSISATTRQPRPYEQDGKHYYFYSSDEFRKLIENDALVEYEEVYPGKFYGTLRSEMDRIWREGLMVLFDLDVKGASNLKSIYSEQCLSLFIEPESVEVLRERLNNRKTETEDSIEERLSRAEFELTFRPEFDYSIVNKDLDQAVEEAKIRVLEFVGLDFSKENRRENAEK